MSLPLRIAMLGVRGLASGPPPRFGREGRLEIGGAEVAAEQLSRHLVLRGHEVTLFARGGAPFTSEGVQVEPTWFLAGRRTEALTHSFWTAGRILGRQYDVVHFHAVGPGSAAVLARLAGRPSVLTVQGLDWERKKWGAWERRFFSVLGAFALRQVTATIAVAPSLVHPLQELGARRVTCIPNGFQAPGSGDPRVLEGLGLTPGQFLLMLTRLVPEKNIHRVIPAYLRSRVPWPLVIAGGGSHSDSYVDELRRLAKGSGRVRFVGVAQGARKATLLQGAGAFLNASTVEGLSVALLEALGMGIPTAISPIPMNLDVFAMAGNAPSPTLLDVQDEENLTKGLEQLVERAELDRPLWRGFASQVRARFSWEVIAGEVEQVYLEVVNR